MQVQPLSPKAAQSLAAEVSARTAQESPLRKILGQCKQTFYLIVGLTYVLELISLAPMLYLLNAYDRVLSSRSGITLVSLTLIIVAVFVFWGALEWIRERLMVRLSLRIDWDVGPDVFDASFRSHALRKNVDVHQLLGDLMDLRQFLTGAPLLAIIQAPFALVFGGTRRPSSTAFPELSRCCSRPWVHCASPGQAKMRGALSAPRRLRGRYSSVASSGMSRCFHCPAYS
jgi:ABC-type bacteriocin/lantibiotic exporter with double-glycine peptidase domain